VSRAPELLEQVTVPLCPVESDRQANCPVDEGEYLSVERPFADCAAQTQRCNVNQQDGPRRSHTRLQPRRVITRSKAVGQRIPIDPGPNGLPCGPFVAVQPHP
jgi:hypothetical protein